MLWGHLKGVSLAVPVVAVVMCGVPVLAATAPSTDADILFQQLDISGAQVDLQAGGGSGTERYIDFIGQHGGTMPPYVRLSVQLNNVATTSGTPFNFTNGATIPVVLEMFNPNNFSNCAMLRIVDMPASWANDGQFHTLEWTPTSRVFNPNANHCEITPGNTYQFGIFTGYSNVQILAAADGSETPYVVNSLEPIDIVFPAPATPYPSGVLWQSVQGNSDEVSVYAGVPNVPNFFNQTRFNNTIPLGIWDGPDFTTTASTSVHVWMRSADQNNSAVFDIGLGVSSGGNPYVSQPDYAQPLIYGFPFNNNWIRTNVVASPEVQEQTFPTNPGVTMHTGDQLWGFLYPSFATLGQNVFMGGVGNTPQFRICEGECVESIQPQYCTPGTDPDCNSNVMFLPGMGGSRLYRPSRPDEQTVEHRLWEPNGDIDAQNLNLDTNGKSLRSDIYTRDALDEAYSNILGPGGLNIYKSFITKMDGLKSDHRINDFKVIPYDWRLSLDDILAGGTLEGENISYTSTSVTPYIIDTLKKLAVSSRTGKVTIIAHSNGGLVTKALLLKHPELNQYVDKIIFVAVPQVGTPEAIAGLLHGHGLAIPAESFPIFLSTPAVRALGQNAPVAYNLLPSIQYFSSVSDPVITIDPVTLPHWVNKYGTSITSESALRQFLEDTTDRVSSADTNIKVPSSANSTLITQAEDTHTDIDQWQPASTTEFIQIAGWGVPTTVKGLEYSSTTIPALCSITTPSSLPNFSCEHGLTVTAKTTIDGDDTVVTPSALWTSTSLPNVKRYWVNIQTFNDDHVLDSFGGLLKIGHKSILEIDSLSIFISDIITSSNKPISDYTYISSSAPTSNAKHLRYALHSPLTLDLYDNQGRHTGVATSTGAIEEQIPGTYYMELAGVKYLFTDASSSVHIVMNGYATSTFSFAVEQFQGDTLIASTSFKDIPVTPQTKVTQDIVSDITTLSPMHINLGDGISRDILPVTNGETNLDLTPPEIQIGFSPSTNALVYSATDNAGAVFIMSTTTTPSTKKHQQSIATTTITAKDLAGNTTILVFTSKYPLKDKRIAVSVVSISYNGAVTPLSATLKYKWTLGPDSSYKMFAAYAQTVTTSAEAHYRPKKNQTILMTKPVDFDDADDDNEADGRPMKQKLIGLIVPVLQTHAGKLMITY